MLKFYQLFFIVCVIFFLKSNVQAQGIHQLWGTTTYGGPDDRGTLFTTRFDGTAHDIKNFFTITNPGKPGDRNKPVAFNNKLYSVLNEGGLNNNGIISEYDPFVNAYSKKADLFTIGGKLVQSALTVYNNKLYGVTVEGGAFSKGVLFEFDPATNILVKKHDFNTETGYEAKGDMVVFNNKLYGVTNEGGVNGAGVIYEFDGVYTKKIDIDPQTTGQSNWGGLTVLNNLLWGVTLNDKNDALGGNIFSYDPVVNNISPKVTLKSKGLGVHVGNLAVLNNKLYGITSQGGINGEGAIFEYNPANELLTKKFDLISSKGRCEFTVFNNKLYGLSAIFPGGDIFSYDPQNNQLVTQVNLNALSGFSGSGSLLLNNNKLYGWNGEGAANKQGCLFEYDPAQNVYVKKVELGGTTAYYPSGQLIHHNNKIYGTAWNGGTNQDGVIFEYDIASKQYTLKFNMLNLNGQFYGPSGFVLHNNKFYGVTYMGGNFNSGTLFEYDPVNNIYTKKFNFDNATGEHPLGRLVKINNKLYGTCSEGSTENIGNIFEYNLDNDTYSEKISFKFNTGYRPEAGLTLFEGKLYGTTVSGGTNDRGIIFEYNPDNNAFSPKFNFGGNNQIGVSPRGNLIVYKNKMYGVASNGGGGNIVCGGTLFEYDPLTSIVIKKFSFGNALGCFPIAGVTLLNNKFYGMTYLGGNLDGGVLFEFDPNTDIYTKKNDFVVVNGRRPEYCELTTAPAPTAQGTPGVCASANSATIDASNSNSWVAFTDATGEAVAEINANGNLLGNVNVNYYVHNGPTRFDGQGRLYLDRNITIAVQNQPVSPVSVRLYTRKAEFDALKNTPGSGILNPEDVGVFKNTDNCSASINAAAAQIPSTVSTWGFDHVYAVEVNSFSSFYFANKANIILPINILSFTGKKEGSTNKLVWKISCTNAVNFTVERSFDGENFESIAVISANQQDCGNTFQFVDGHPSETITYYRLRATEDNLPAKYSSIIMLSRSNNPFTQMQFVPNPVSGDNATLQIESSNSQLIQLVISDIAGKKIMVKSIQLNAGKTQAALDVSRLSSGTYQASYEYKGKNIITRFVKK